MEVEKRGEKRKRGEIGIRRKLSQILEKERENVNFCDVKILKHNPYLVEKGDDKKLILISTYLNTNNDIKLYIWNPSMNDDEQVNKLNKLLDIYHNYIIPMLYDEISIFSIPFIASSLCLGKNLVEELLSEKEETKEQKPVNISSRLLILNRFDEFSKDSSFESSNLLWSIDKDNYLKMLFLIYWEVETCQRKGLYFNFKDYRSINFLLLPRETQFVFVLYDNSETYLVYLSVNFIPLIDLYHCKIGEKFDMKYFEEYNNAFRRDKKLRYVFVSSPMRFIYENYHKTMLDQLKKVVFKNEDNYKDVFTRMNSLIRRNKRYLNEVRGNSIYKLNQYAMIELITTKHDKLYHENIMYIDERIRSNFLPQLKIKNSLEDFIIETLYSNFIPTGMQMIEIEEKPRLFQYISFREGWQLVSNSQLSYRGEYIFDFNDKKNYLGRGRYGAVWVACKRSDRSIHFDPNCKYAAKFIKIDMEFSKDKFEKEYAMAKKMSDQNLTVKIFDHYFVHNVIDFEDIRDIEKKFGFGVGVIIMERWPMTLLKYIETTKPETYEIYRDEIKDNWMHLYMRLYDLGYKIPDMHFNNTMIRFVNNKPELTLIDFGLARKVDNRELAEELFFNTYDINEHQSFHLIEMRKQDQKQAQQAQQAPQQQGQQFIQPAQITSFSSSSSSSSIGSSSSTLSSSSSSSSSGVSSSSEKWY